MSTTNESSSGLRLISFDGGGARSLSQLKIMVIIMHRIRWKYYSGDPAKIVLPCECYDMMAGSDTGGLIVIMFCKLRMSAEEALDEFRKIRASVYIDGISATERTNRLKNSIEEMLVKRGLPVDLKLETQEAQTECPCLLIATYKASVQDKVRLRNYYSSALPSNVTIVEAVLATCAAQPLFLSTLLGPDLGQQELIGGAAGAANPSIELILELKNKFQKERVVSTLLSLGLGHPGNLSAMSTNNWACLWQSLVNDGEHQAREVHRMVDHLGIYFRFSVQHGLSQSETRLNDHGWIDTQTDVYLDDYLTSQKLNEYMDALHARQGSTTVGSVSQLGAPKLGVDFISGRLEAINDKIASLQENKLLEDLKPADLKQETRPNICKEGTRQDILDTIGYWIADTNAPNILWLKGYPGVGKSAIASTLVDCLQEARRLGSYFFFQRAHASLLTPHSLWRTVAYHLARYHSMLSKAIVTKLQADITLPTTANLDKLFQQLIHDPLVENRHLLADHLPVIIIDAVDECGWLSGNSSEYRRGVISTIAKWATLPRQFKLIITSRGEEDIERSLNKISRTVEILTGARVSDQSSKDIEGFLSTELNDIASNYPSLKTTNWPGSETIKLLSARAAGLFIWAKVAVEFIRSGRPQRQLTRLLEGGATEENLQALYAQILDDAFLRADEQDYRDFRRIIGTVVVAKAPLSQRSIEKILSIDITDIEFICSKLKSVLDYDSTLQIIHQSFSDFLMDPACPEKFRIDLGDAEHDLAVACLQIMNYNLHFNICQLESSYLMNAEVASLESRIKDHISDHLIYASWYWANHLLISQYDDGIASLLRDFMRNQFLSWLEVLSLTKRVSQASSIVSLLIDWLSNSNQDTSSAVDMKKFIETFAPAISSSVPHIYLSALPFAPQSSVVLKPYNHLYSRNLKVLGGGLTKWPLFQIVFYGHNEGVTSLAFSPDGAHIVSGSLDKTARVWDAATGNAIGGPLVGHTAAVTFVSFSLNGLHIMSVSRDKTVRKWDTMTGGTIGHPYTNKNIMITSIAISPDGRRTLFGSEDGMVYIQDVEMCDVTLKSLSGHTKPVISVAFCCEGAQIFTVSQDKTVRVWDARTGSPVARPFSVPTESLTCAKLSPDRKHIASGSWDGKIAIWDLATGKEIGGPFTGHTEWVTSIAFSFDGTRIVSGSRDKMVIVWEIEQCGVARSFKGHNDWVTSVAFSPDGTRIVSGSRDKTAIVWDAGAGDILAPSDKQRHSTLPLLVKQSLGPVTKDTDISSIKRTIYRVIPSADTHYSTPFTSSLLDGVQNIITTGGVMEALRRKHKSITSVAFSPDSTQIASGSRGGRVSVWDARTGKATIRRLKGHTGPIISISFSPDGARIISSSKERVKVWNTMTGDAVIYPFMGHNNSLIAHKSPTPLTYTTARNLGREVDTLFDHSATRDPIFDSAAIVDPTSHGTSSFTGTTILSGLTGDLAASSFTMDSTCNIPTCEYELPNAHRSVLGNTADCQCFLSRDPPSHFSGHLSSFAYSPNDATSVLPHQVWTTTNLPADHIHANALNKGIHSVSAVAFSADGKFIAWGSRDGMTRTWNVSTGESVDPPKGHTQGVTCVAFSQDGTCVASGSGNGRMMVWKVTEQGGIIGPWTGHLQAVTSISFLSGDANIISCSLDDSVMVWEAATGNKVARPFQTHFPLLASLGHLATTAYRVSERDDRKRMQQSADINSLKDKFHSVVSFSPSPDGTRIAFGSLDGTVSVWDTATTSVLGEPFRGHSGAVTSVSFSHDGTRIVSGSNDMTLRVWDITQLGKQVIKPLTDDFRIIEGWVVDSKSRRLFWVPPALRDGLMRPSEVLIIGGRFTRTKLDATQFKCGKSWKKCRSSA